MDNLNSRNQVHSNGGRAVSTGITKQVLLQTYNIFPYSALPSVGTGMSVCVPYGLNQILSIPGSPKYQNVCLKKVFVVPSSITLRFP